MERPRAPAFDAETKIFLEAVNDRYNYDFSNYAPASVQRTLVTAMDKMRSPSVTDLQQRIMADPAAFDDLVQHLTIPFSELFRDPSYFLALRQRVIPRLRTYPSLKIWVAGCSTGEEVYSLAILLEEEGLLERTILYATDINSRSLTTAARGAFTLSDMPAAAERHQKAGGTRPLTDYYAVDGATATFHPALRRGVTFSDHSLATDSVFSETHLISCRNVLIYFNRALQDRTFRLFKDSLRRKCFLGLGGRETIQFSACAHFFETFSKDERIFQTK